MDIEIAVRNIAKNVTSAVGAMASSGALTPMEMKNLSDCVVTDVIEDNTEEGIFKKWVQNTLRYPEYYDLFVENGVDTLNVAKLLTKSELKMIGINNIGHLVKIMEGIQALNQNEDKLPAPVYQQPVEGVGTLMI